MNKVLVDSDVVIWFLRDRQKEVDLVETLASKNNLFISVVTITEIRTGLQKDTKEIIEKLVDLFTPINIDAKTAELAGKFKQKYNLQIADMFIAATAEVNDLTLLTYNKKNFPMKSIKLYKWEK